MVRFDITHYVADEIIGWCVENLGKALFDNAFVTEGTWWKYHAGFMRDLGDSYPLYKQKLDLELDEDAVLFRLTYPDAKLEQK